MERGLCRHQTCIVSFTLQLPWRLFLPNVIDHNSYRKKEPLITDQGPGVWVTLGESPKELVIVQEFETKVIQFVASKSFYNLLSVLCNLKFITCDCNISV